MEIYKFEPADPRSVFASSPGGVMHRSGGTVECSRELAEQINASYPGIDGAPALSLLNPPKPERKTRRSRKPKAEG